MNEQEFNLKRDRFGLVSSDTYKELRRHQLDMIVDKARNNYEPLEIRGMLRLIGLTDEWREDFIKLKEKRK